jgi:hypothetical protein
MVPRSEKQSKLNNVIFMLDVSNSMNAEDIEPKPSYGSQKSDDADHAENEE